MSDAAKSDILRRIRRAALPAAGLGSVPASEPVKDPVGQFCEFAAEYRAHVQRVSSAGVAAAIAQCLAARGSSRVVIPLDFPSDWRTEGMAVDNGSTTRELDSFDAVVTACALGIAETGTVVLDAGVGQGRRAITLVPDHHVCIIRESQILASVVEAVMHLEPSVERGQPLTWISGPSATSDIELIRVEGVHGPRKLDILVVGA